jgi:hypothetical protein
MRGRNGRWVAALVASGVKRVNISGTWVKGGE